MRTAKLNSLGHQSQQLLHFPVSKALSSATKPRELHKILSLLIVSGLDKSVFFSGKLISKYAQFKEPLACLSIFRQISPTRNVYQWNTIIRAMTRNGFYSDALNFYSKMGKLNIQPDTYTFPSVINACAGLLDFQMGNLAHDHVVEMGFGSDLYIGNAFIDMYARFNELSRARNMFDEMPHKDIVSWNSLISGYCSNGFWKEALEIFQQSRMVGMLPDFVTVSSVLPACASLVAVDDREVVHEQWSSFYVL